MKNFTNGLIVGKFLQKIYKEFETVFKDRYLIKTDVFDEYFDNINNKEKCIFFTDIDNFDSFDEMIKFCVEKELKPFIITSNKKEVKFLEGNKYYIDGMLVWNNNRKNIGLKDFVQMINLEI